MGANKTNREKARWKLHKNVTSYIEQILKAIPNETIAVLTSDLKNHPSKTNMKSVLSAWHDDDDDDDDILKLEEVLNIANKFELKVLQYFSNMRHDSAASDPFAFVAKVTNNTGLWYVKLAWCFAIIFWIFVPWWPNSLLQKKKKINK